LQAFALPLVDGHGNSALAQAIIASRGVLRERLFAATASSGAPTLLLDVLADSLIDRGAKAATDGNVAAFEAWAEAMCVTRADTPAVHNLFLSFGPALAETLGGNAFEQLAERLAPVVQRLRAPLAGAPADTVDELDLLLADMVARVEHNDPMTAEHCRAVSAWCARIAHRLSLTRGEASFVARGGLIHDVGKSVTPLEILQAPRPLTDSEWIVMREHTVTGDDIVRDHRHLRDFAPIVRSHHERFDGRGYPDRLESSRIPIAVRIVTVADSFNAMIGRRPYRTPLSPDRAIAELRRNSGTQFDPNVVVALIDVVGAMHEPSPATGVIAC
jgi:putative nucleotidyltransferase with HDIG domain